MLAVMDIYVCGGSVRNVLLMISPLSASPIILYDPQVKTDDPFPSMVNNDPKNYYEVAYLVSK